MLCWCKSRTETSAEVFTSLYFIKRENICVTVLIFPFVVLLLLYCIFWEKTSCMIQQYFQSCCIYPLWICCDCTVLYRTISGNYMVLCVCQGLHTLTHTYKQTHTHRVPNNQSNIVRKWSKCTLTGLVLSTCVLCTVFPLPCDNASANKEFLNSSAGKL